MHRLKYQSAVWRILNVSRPPIWSQTSCMSRSKLAVSYLYVTFDSCLIHACLLYVDGCWLL